MAAKDTQDITEEILGARPKVRRHSGNKEENEKNPSRKRNYSGENKYEGLYPELGIRSLIKNTQKTNKEKKELNNGESLNEIVSLCKLFNESIRSMSEENRKRDERLNNAFGVQQQQFAAITEQILSLIHI